MRRRLRRSTVVLSAIFVATLLIYLLVRPEPRSLAARDTTPTPTVPATTTQTMPDTTRPTLNATTTTTEPAPTTTRPRPEATTSTSLGTSTTTVPHFGATTTTG
jgi:hypothetical protein